MATGTTTSPPKWVYAERNQAKPKSPPGFEYVMTKRWSPCGTVGCLLIWPIGINSITKPGFIDALFSELLANLTPFFDNTAEGDACSMIYQDWWMLKPVEV